jgi:hypothetical protein
MLKNKVAVTYGAGGGICDPAAYSNNGLALGLCCDASAPVSPRSAALRAFARRRSGRVDADPALKVEEYRVPRVWLIWL